MQSDEVTEKHAGTSRREGEQTKRATEDLEEEDQYLDAEQSGAESSEINDGENSDGGFLYTCVWSFVRNYVIFPLFSRPSREKRGEAEGEGFPGAPPRAAGKHVPRSALKNMPWNSGLFGYKAPVARDPFNFRLLPVDTRGVFKQENVALQTEDYKDEITNAAVDTADDQGSANVTDEIYEPANAPESEMFSDGSRRTDLVLVLRKGVGEADQEEQRATRNVLLNFFTGLVKLGLHIEVDAGVLPEHRHLEFVKLHAPDIVLNTYAEVFGVKKYFRDSHEQFMNNRKTRFGSLIEHEHEREWIKIVRSQYEGPLRLSPLDRSYIVYQLLQYQTFGKPSNYYSLRRLLDNNIVVDAFALHDAPLRPLPGQPVFTCRQILYLNWLSPRQIFKNQPLNLINEYFGSKLALYFALYELVNKMLLVSSLWGAVCSLLYWFKDLGYLQHTRQYFCENIGLRDPSSYWKMPNEDARYELGYYSVVCAECEGVNDTDVCPYTLMMDYCFDLHMMRIFDNPYVILYSLGIAFFALWLAFQWQRAESFWRWMWEETGTLRLARSRYQPRGEGWIALVSDVSVNFLQTVVIEVLLPIFVVVSIVWTMFVAFIYNYEWLRRMSTTKYKLNITSYNRTTAWDISPPIVDRPKEYAVLMAIAACVHILFFVAEKLCHWISYWSTRAENHRSQEQFDESLCNKYFTFSFVYSSSLVIYFAWIKGAFYYSPLSSWDLIVNLTTPWRHYSVNLSAELSPRWFHLLRLAVTMNCGPYSCVRQGFVVFLVTLAFRVVLVSLVPLLWRWGQTCCEESRSASYYKPNVEREYQLKRVGNRQIAEDLNTLVLHFSLVLLFAPLFPLAPLVLLLVNVCDLRSKARMYLVSRRAVLQRPGRARGGREGVLPTAGDILRAVCYAVPLCHGLCIARMEVIKIYVYHKWTRRSLDAGLFLKFLHEYNYRFDNVLPSQTSKVDRCWFAIGAFIMFLQLTRKHIFSSSMSQQQFLTLNRYRISDQRLNYSRPLFLMYDYPVKLNWFWYEPLYFCRVNGFLQRTAGRTSAVWPAQAPAMHENVTNSAPMPEHYEWLFYKALFVLLYTVAFAVVAACMWQCGAGWSGGVCARAAREATLRRLRLGERGPMSLRQATRDARLAQNAPPHSPPPPPPPHN